MPEQQSRIVLNHHHIWLTNKLHLSLLLQFLRSLDHQPCQPAVHDKILNRRMFLTIYCTAVDSYLIPNHQLWNRFHVQITQNFVNSIYLLWSKRMTELGSIREDQQVTNCSHILHDAIFEILKSRSAPLLPNINNMD